VHVTQSGEKEEAHFDGSRVSYLFGDLRDLPFQDDWFDSVVCISTLEHIGMDNTRYGGPHEENPASYLDAVSELRRVLRPEGTLFLSFPAGTARRLGWFQVLGAQEVSAVLERLAPDDPKVRYFSYEGSWVESDARRAEQIDDEDKEIVKSVAVVTATKTGAPDGPPDARSRADERDRRPA
jgi:SAM-dependent methyltransferase